MTYIVVDTANTFFRSRHVVQGSADVKVGMALHIIFNSIKKAWKDFDGKHIVFCLEGRSWRKDFYTPYKAQRAETRAAMTVKEQEEDALFWETFDEFKNFITEKTNCTVLQHPRLEADDLIAGFIQSHPHENHVIISSDSDFYQLLATNVKQYNGISEELHTIEGILDKKGKPVIDKKTSEPKKIPKPEWILFEKCIRGDTSDNVFSAYPGVRTKGTKNKVGLIEAYADREKQGFSWNNLQLQRWSDHNNVEHRVRDDYERNKVLIDLTAQPQDIKDKVDASIREGVRTTVTPQVGIHFMKFCGAYELTKISEQSDTYCRWLNNPYKGSLT